MSRNPIALGQRCQTDSAAFRAWFGNSKVVAQDGKPLAVYHGTQYDVDAFDPEMQGDTVYSEDIGFFFTNDLAEANSYATFDWGRDSPKPNVMPSYLSIKNPEIVTLENEQSPYDSPALWYDSEGQEVAQNAIDSGRDGLIVIDNRVGFELPDGSKPTLFIAFKPTQIKSATGNRGTFSPTDSDIRCSHSVSNRERAR